MPKPSYRLLLFSGLGPTVPSPEVSVWFAEREDAEVLAALTAEDFGAVALVEYPKDGGTPRLVGYEGVEGGRDLLAEELKDPDLDFEPCAEMMFDADGEVYDDAEDEDDDEAVAVPAEGDRGFVLYVGQGAARRFDA